MANFDIDATPSEKMLSFNLPILTMNIITYKAENNDNEENVVNAEKLSFSKYSKCHERIIHVENYCS